MKLLIALALVVLVGCSNNTESPLPLDQVQKHHSHGGVVSECQFITAVMAEAIMIDLEKTTDRFPTHNYNNRILTLADKFGFGVDIKQQAMISASYGQTELWYRDFLVDGKLDIKNFISQMRAYCRIQLNVAEVN